MYLAMLPQEDLLGFLVQIGWLAFIVFSIFYGQRLQMWTMLREVGSSLARFKSMKDEGRRLALSAIKELGKPKIDPNARLDQFLESQVFAPVDMDPQGIVWKLEHVLDVRDVRFKDEVKIMAPEANETQIKNLEDMLGAALVLNLIYKIVRHFYLLGKKTMNLYIIMQVQMVLPLLMIEAKAYANALRAIKNGQPIGDGAGPLVAGKLMRKHEKRNIAKDIVVSKLILEDRTAYVIKAKGPGAAVGKLGDGIKRIIDENDGKIASLITIDAQQKYEGEEAGKVTEGVGVAIGPGGNGFFAPDSSTIILQ